MWNHLVEAWLPQSLVLYLDPALVPDAGTESVYRLFVWA